MVAGLTSTENIESQKNAQKRKVSKITIHPDWFSSHKSYGDIAVVEVIIESWIWLSWNLISSRVYPLMNNMQYKICTGFTSICYERKC